MNRFRDCGTKNSKRAYTVSKDQKSGLWYAHMKGFGYIPIAGSFSRNKGEAMEYAKMYNGLPHRVEQIETRKREEFERYLAED